MKHLFKTLGIALLFVALLADIRAQTTPSVVTMQSAATATGNGTAIVIGTSAAAPGANLGAVGIQITGTFSATITFEATTDGSNWTAVMATNLNDDSRATTATAAGHYTILYGSAIRVRARISSYSSGSVTITGRLIPGLTARLTSGGGGGGSGTVTSVAQSFTGGLISVGGSPVTTSGTLALTVAGTSGGIPYFSSGSTWASSAALAANAIMIGGGAGVAPSTTTTGTGVVTALGVNVGSAGAFVVNGGALGTPSSGTLTNATGLPISTGLTGAGTGVLTALGVNVGSAGAFVVNGGALGTPSSGTLTSATGLPISTGVSGLGTGVATALAVNTGSAGAVVLFNGAGGTPSSLTLTNATGLPPTTGISGWPANASGVLTNNGSGTLSWAAAGGGITVGTTTITSGTNTKVLFNNSGIVGEYTITGTGNVMMSASPTTTGTLGAAAATFSSTIAQSSTSATAFASGASSSTPSFLIDNSTASQASGMKVIGKADGTAPELKAISRTQTTASIAGNGIAITADPAIAGSSSAGAAAGGNVTLTAGDAARLTSGNADGGAVVLVPGAGIGTGTVGMIALGGATSSFPAFKYFNNSFSVPSVGLRKGNNTSDNGSMHVGALGVSQSTASDTGNTIALVAASGQVTVGSSGSFEFSSSVSSDLSTMNGGDTGLARSAAKTIRITDGSTGAATFSVAAVTPSQITADQNNYAPGVGWFHRWSSDASRNITGLTAGVDGQVIEIWNVGSQNIVLQNQNASSTAANRFLTSTGADLTLTADKCAEGRYDNTTQRWRVRLCN